MKLKWKLTSHTLLVIFAILLPSLAIDYYNQRSSAIKEATADLEDEMRLLRLSVARMRSVEEIKTFASAYCHRMARHDLPGHQLLLIGKNGDIIVRGMDGTSSVLENKLLAVGKGKPQLVNFSRHVLLVSSVELGQSQAADPSLRGARLVNSLYMDQFLYRLRVYRIFRLAIILLVAVSIVALLNFLIGRDVLRPLQSFEVAVERFRKEGPGAEVSVRTKDEFYDLATVFNRMSLELKERRLAHEQEMAHAISIQRKLIPRGDLTVPGFAIQSFYFPGAGLGGDLFAVIPVGARYFFAMADVEGHGVAAALVGTLLKSLVEMQAKAGKSPAQILSLANRNLCVDLHLDLSVSMILIEYDFSKESLRYANAGHLPPFILRPGQAQLQELKSASLILGASQEESYQDAESRLAPGDRLFLYTDGLTEMPMENGFPFNRTGLANFLLERKSASLEVISVELMRYLERRRAEAINPDDVSFLAIERL